MKFLDSPFDDELLYVVDGELLNHLVKLLSALDIIDDKSGIHDSTNKQKVLRYLLKSVIQCSNYPTGEARLNGELDYIEFENMLWEMGIRLPNEEDPNNQYPKEDR
tara:strand:+ start:101 stop:418 length:318 start_codon:yes stop_codon:yes gene_type:complete